MKTSDLLVEAFFVPSVLASHNREDRLALALGDALRGRPIGVPHRLLLAGLREDEGHAARHAKEEDEL
jgi:hypothetical protein